MCRWKSLQYWFSADIDHYLKRFEKIPGRQLVNISYYLAFQVDYVVYCGHLSGLKILPACYNYCYLHFFKGLVRFPLVAFRASVGFNTEIVVTIKHRPCLCL